MAELSADARAFIERMAASGSRAAAIGRLAARLAWDLQAPFDVPNAKPPVLLTAHLGDFGQGVIVFVRLNPKAGKTGGNVLGQTLRKWHDGNLDVGRWEGIKDDP